MAHRNKPGTKPISFDIPQEIAKALSGLRPGTKSKLITQLLSSCVELIADDKEIFEQAVFNSQLKAKYCDDSDKYYEISKKIYDYISKHNPTKNMIMNDISVDQSLLDSIIDSLVYEKLVKLNGENYIKVP